MQTWASILAICIAVGLKVVTDIIIVVIQLRREQHGRVTRLPIRLRWLFAVIFLIALLPVIGVVTCAIELYFYTGDTANRVAQEAAALGGFSTILGHLLFITIPLAIATPGVAYRRRIQIGAVFVVAIVVACDVLGSIFIQDTTPNDYAAILLSCGSILAFLYSGFTMCVLLRTLGWRLFTLEFWKIWISCFIDLFALCLLIPSLMFRHSQWLLFETVIIAWVLPLPWTLRQAYALKLTKSEGNQSVTEMNLFSGQGVELARPSVATDEQPMTLAEMLVA